ncbi:type IX secretion system motor protein PorM/GldM [Muribaculum intestinale]|uniref:type IX secretion system motor protein PorM/GldM n=1 Tax=Muribaculum intestinale TaxID=1796646 RepID=UPI001C3ED255|nr:gliding motility protein GldM [Muribaculum intestinale]
MGSNNTRSLSPRQKMINLMYIVLTAMLALNVSSDVLDGFGQVEEGLARSNATVDQRNEAVFRRLEAFAEQNPGKGAAWLDKAAEVRSTTSRVYGLIDTLKMAIAIEADGNNANLANILNQDNLDAASIVMLSPRSAKGKHLRSTIDYYRNYIGSLMSDSLKRDNIMRSLSTEQITRRGTVTPQLWEEAMFENKPVIAAITLLTKLQSDIRYAEGEALSTLLANVDAGDVRVNELNAFVIPQSRNVMRGSRYSANIVLAAVDTTQRPTIYINGKQLDNDRGLFETLASSTGNFDYSGYLEVPHGDGTVTRHDFNSSYTVIEPTATISATMMNVLYAGIDNPMSISVPGIAPSAISASMTNGTLSRHGDSWVARPGKVGTEAVVTVTANIDGRPQTVATTSFRVRKLPDPAPFISYTDSKGHQERYKGSKPFPKTLLLQAPGIEAAIDDNLLNVSYRVLSFETVFFDSMGNAIPEVSQGSQFSQRQKDSFRRLQRGKRFYISRVKAIGPDGIERDLAPMEVIVN